MTSPDPTTQPIAWEHTGNGEFPYQAWHSGTQLLLRVNDFPAEPLYTLFVDYRAVLDLEDWPPLWLRPAPSPDHLRTAGTEQLRRGRIDAIVIADWAHRLCTAPPGPASALLAALGLPSDSHVLEPPSPGLARLDLIEDNETGTVSALRLTPANGGPTRAALTALLGPETQPAPETPLGTETHPNHETQLHPATRPDTETPLDPEIRRTRETQPDTGTRLDRESQLGPETRPRRGTQVGRRTWPDPQMRLGPETVGALERRGPHTAQFHVSVAGALFSCEVVAYYANTPSVPLDRSANTERSPITAPQPKSVFAVMPEAATAPTEQVPSAEVLLRRRPAQPETGESHGQARRGR